MKRFHSCLHDAWTIGPILLYNFFQSQLLLFQLCAQKGNSRRRNSKFLTLLPQPSQNQIGGYESLAAKSEIPIPRICHCPRASGICEVVSHEHIPNGARALGALFLPGMIYEPCQSSRLNCRDNWSMQQRAQQSISTSWESPRNPSRASSWWHLRRGRRRNKGKRWRQSEQGVGNPPRISQNFKAMEVKQDDRYIFWVFSKTKVVLPQSHKLQCLTQLSRAFQCQQYSEIAFPLASFVLGVAHFQVWQLHGFEGKDILLFRSCHWQKESSRAPLQSRKVMPCSSRNIKQAPACHYRALEFVLWPKADTSARARLFLQKTQAHIYEYARPTRTQDHTRPYTKPMEAPKFRKIQQVSIHKEKGKTQRLSVSGIYRYGRNVEDADTHSSCSASMNTREYIVCLWSTTRW